MNNQRNNNNNNNNRRRGRGNNRNGNGGGGGSPVNRIDSRARGNAPQMLEKYRKMAHEASLNDDRVQTEYYLQFADHYFRVIADSRAQKDDSLGGRPGRTDQQEDDGEYYGDDRFDDPARRPQQRQDRGPAPQGGDDDQDADRGGEGQRGAEGDNFDEENPFTPASQPRPPRQDREVREKREPRENREPRDTREVREPREAREAREPRETRENREPRAERPRQERRPRRDEQQGVAREEPAPAFDPGLLPPSISRSGADNSGAAASATGDDEAAPKPRRPRTRRRTEGEDGSETLEAIG